MPAVKVRSSAGSAPATAGLQPGKRSDHCISGAGGRVVWGRSVNF